MGTFHRTLLSALAALLLSLFSTAGHAVVTYQFQSAGRGIFRDVQIGFTAPQYVGNTDFVADISQISCVVADAHCTGVKLSSGHMLFYDLDNIWDAGFQQATHVSSTPGQLTAGFLSIDAFSGNGTYFAPGTGGGTLTISGFAEFAAAAAPTVAVPEMETWVLLMVGFALVGFMLRRPTSQIIVA